MVCSATPLFLQRKRFDSQPFPMAVEPIIWREPETFISGDSLIFSKYLSGYLPADGWVLHYVVTQSLVNDAKKVAQFFSSQSTFDPSCHSINVPDFGTGLDPSGEYLLTGQVVNAVGNSGKGIAAGQKQTFYIGELAIDPDLADGLATAPVTTFAQQMLDTLKVKLARLESYDLTEADVQRTKFVIEDKNKTWERYWRLVEFRNYELKGERQKNTGISQNQIIPKFSGGW